MIWMRTTFRPKHGRSRWFWRQWRQVVSVQAVKRAARLDKRYARRHHMTVTFEVK